MLKYCLDKWNKNKGLLEGKLRSASTLNDLDYVDLVKMVVDFVLNQGESEYGLMWASEHITVVDDGHYQGTQLFLIPKRGYQPAEFEYLMTYVGYGSCSGCDTLQSIQDCSREQPNERQLKDFMHLCKDLLTNMIKPYNGGWRFDADFAEVEM